MRILHIVPSLAARYGGPAKSVVEMCRELARRGHEVALYTTDRDGKGRLEVPLGEPIIGDDGVERRYFPARGAYSFSLSFAAAVKKAIPAYDLVHVHSLYRFTSTAACYYCRRYGVPYIVQPHGSLDPYIFYHHPERKRAYELLVERRNLEAAAVVHFTADEEMELARSLGLRFTGAVAPYGVSVGAAVPKDGRAAFGARWPECIGKTTILFLSRINFKKGLDLLARAFGAVARVRDDVHLMVAGPDDEGYGRRVRRWLREEGVAEHVTFAGMLFDEEKKIALAGAEIFALPSYSENFGIAVTEAMASGLPVLISNRVNIWRSIADAGAGIVTECDADAIARGLLKLIDDPQERAAMGERGRRLIATRFTWNVAVERLLDMYREVVAGPAAALHPYGSRRRRSAPAVTLQ
jgi:glycosyltransferase involved in cell wall biosynthesis